MSDTLRLGLPLLEAGQAQKHITHNEALLLLDAAVQLSVLSRVLTAPPVSPAEGDRYLVAATATAAWAGHEGDVAVYDASAWRFLTPQTGWRLWDGSSGAVLVFDGTAWRGIVDGAALANLAMVGVNATADAGNRLTVASPGVLFNHEGGDHRLKINKQAAANTAALLYQTGYSGRAEMGLTGDDQFHIKVSADGSTWKEAITVDAATGEVALPNTSTEWAAAVLAADVAMPVSNVWYDGPALALTPGTWLVQAHLTQIRAATTAETIFARISDDTVHYASTQQFHASLASVGVSLAMTAVVTLAATATVKLQAATSAGNAASAIKAVLTANASGTTATQLTAVRLA